MRLLANSLKDKQKIAAWPEFQRQRILPYKAAYGARVTPAGYSQGETARGDCPVERLVERVYVGVE